MRNRFLFGSFVLFIAACIEATPRPDPRPDSGVPTSAVRPMPGTILETYTIPPMLDWMDPYAKTDLGTDVRYFRIKKLMTDFKLSRFFAVELQNHYRHLTASGVAPLAAWEQSLAAAQAEKTLSGVDPVKLRAAPFIVIYDLDETLYQLSHKDAPGPRGRDFSYPSRGQQAFITLRPGWQRAITRVHELGGLVLFFTARSDDVAEGAAQKWSLGEKNIRQLVDGFFSKSHLVMQEKSDGDPIVMPSKDLRVFDESLERVILIDDNPRRVVQHNRQRLVKKFQADPYLAAKNSAPGTSPLTAAFEQTLSSVVTEIEESVAYTRSHPGTSFARAYAPYTMLGQVAMESLLKSGLAEAAARSYIRENPTYVDEAF
jgi:hypothetical protein